MFAKYFVKFQHDKKLMICGFADKESADKFAECKGGELLVAGKTNFKLLKSYK
jgi:hypothetical protein